VARDVTVTGLDDVDAVRIYDRDATDLSPEAGREIEVQDGIVTLSLTEQPVFLIAERLSPWDRIWRDIQRKIKEWWEQRQADLAEWWEQFLAELQARIEELLEEAQHRFVEWLETQLQEYLDQLCGQLCGTAMLPGAAALLWWTRRSRRR